VHIILDKTQNFSTPAKTPRPIPLPFFAYFLNTAINHDYSYTTYTISVDMRSQGGLLLEDFMKI